MSNVKLNMTAFIQLTCKRLSLDNRLCKTLTTFKMQQISVYFYFILVFSIEDVK